MSARSSVTRQTSQESDANNNFGSSGPVVNGQAGGVQFVVPTMQQGQAMPQTGYPPQQNAATVQHLQRMAPNGANHAAAFGQIRQQQPPPGAAGNPNAPPPPYGNPAPVPMLSAPAGAYLQRHQIVGHPTGHNFYTLALDHSQTVAQSGVAAAATGNVTSQGYYVAPGYPPAQITSPPPTSNLGQAAYPTLFAIGSPPVAYQAPFTPSYAALGGFMNGQPAQYASFAPPQFMGHQGVGLDYGQMGPAQQQSQTATDIATSMPAVSASMVVSQNQQPYQQYQSQPMQQQQQQPPRKKNIIRIQDPATNEDITDLVIKEMEEDRQKHPHKLGGSEHHATLMEHGEGRPSRSTTATPQAAPAQGANVENMQSEMTQGLNAYYSAFTDAVAGGTTFDSPTERVPPVSQSEGHFVQSDRVVLPPGPSDHVDFTGQLVFLADTSTAVVSKEKTPEDILGKSDIQFGLDDEKEENVAASTTDQVESNEGKEEVMMEEVQQEAKAAEPEPEVMPVITVESSEPVTLESNVETVDSNQHLDNEPSAAEEVQFEMKSTTFMDTSADLTASTAKDDMSKTEEDNVEPSESVLDDATDTSVDKAQKSEDGDELLVELEKQKDADGALRYNHEFMLLAAKLPASKMRPDFNTDRWSSDTVDDVFNLQKRQSQARGTGGSFRPSGPGGIDFNTFNTAWMKTSPIGPPSARRPYPGRSSDTTGARAGGRQRASGRGSMMKPVQIIPMLLPDVELSRAENAWKPGRKAEPTDEAPEKAETDKLFKEVRGLLNKITPQTFDELSLEFLNLEPRMNTKERAVGAVEIVFQKAVDEPNFCRMYSNLYERMTRHQFDRQQKAAAASGAITKTSSNTLNRDTNFRFILLSKCQTEFEKENKLDALKKEREAAIETAETPEKKKQLQDELDEMLVKEKYQTLGNMRFIGELYHKNMLTAKIMHRCVIVLLKKSNDDMESLECLCKLLTTIGQKLEADVKSEFHAKIPEYYRQLEQLSKSPELPNRFKFMIMDLFDLRKNNWQARRKGDGPKTIDEIHKEAEAEKLSQKIALDLHELNKSQQMESSPTRGSRRGRRQDVTARGSYGTPDRRDYDGRGARASMGRDQGRQQAMQPESTSKFKQPALSQHLDPSCMKLGPQKGSWSKGAGVQSTTTPIMSATLPRAAAQESFRLSNRFDQLASDERYSIGSASSSRDSSQTRYDDRKNVRQLVGSPVSTTKPLERQDGTSSPPVQQQSQESQSGASDYDEEKLRRYGAELIDELVESHEWKEALVFVEERISNADRMLGFALYRAVDKGEKHRRMLGELFARVHTINGIGNSIGKGVACCVHTALDEDLAQDVPKLWANIGEVLAVSILNSESASRAEHRLMLTDFRDAFHDAGDKIGAEILAQTLLSVKNASSSDEKVTALYRSSIDVSSIINDQAMEAALRKHRLDFLLTTSMSSSAATAVPSSTLETGGIARSASDIGTSGKGPATPPSTPVSVPFGLSSPNSQSGLLLASRLHSSSELESEKSELKQLVQTGDSFSVDRLIEYLQNTRRFDGEIDECSLALLSALIETLCSRVIVGGELDDSVKVDEEELDHFCKVLSAILKSCQKLELKTLDTLADIYHNYNCPKGLLVKILSSLQEKEVIVWDGFRQWWSENEKSLPGMIRSNGEVKMFFSQFTADKQSDPGSESDQGE